MKTITKRLFCKIIIYERAFFVNPKIELMFDFFYCVCYNHFKIIKVDGIQ